MGDLADLSALADPRQISGASKERIDRALETIRKHLGMDVAYLSEFVDDRIVFRAVDAPGYEKLASVGGSYPLEFSYCQRVFDGRLPELIADTSRDAVAAEMPVTKLVPIGSHMSLPIRRPDGSIYGMFCCLSSKPNLTLNQRDLDTMQVFADLATEQIHTDLKALEEAEKRRARISDLLEAGRFKMVYQPIWNLVQGTPAGFEALCRFDTVPYRSPDMWFSDASLCNLGEELELAAVIDAVKALDRLPVDCYLSVNVSPSTVLGSGLGKVIGHLPLDRLVLEITEHAAVEDYDELVQALAPLRSAGMRLAVDDAGAGYSSLHHIVRLKPDIIKLDMSLTRDIDTDQALRSLASALIHFSRETGATIIAEGIETASEHEMLKMLGIYGGQGYHLGKPAELESILGQIEPRTSSTRHNVA